MIISVLNLILYLSYYFLLPQLFSNLGNSAIARSDIYISPHFVRLIIFFFRRNSFQDRNGLVQLGHWFSPIQQDKDKRRMDHRYKKFDVVELKTDVVDQETNINLGGWQGRIFDFFEDEKGDIVAYIRWDSQTIQQIPKNFIDLCIDNDLSWVDILIGVESLNFGSARDTLEMAEWQRLEALSTYSWSQPGKAGQKAQEVIKSFRKDEGNVLQAWEKYLKDNLHFPFPIRIRKVNKTSHKENQKGIALELNGAEDVYGVMSMVDINGRKVIIPTIDLIVPHNSKNHEYLETYRFWFENG